MFENYKINNFIIILLATLLVLIITVLIFSLNRGIDFSDEGGFLLSYANVDIYRGGIYNYHIIINRLTNWFNPGIIEYRWMPLSSIVITSITLTYGLYKWLLAKKKLKRDFRKFLIILLFISIGSFLFRFSGLATISNNTLTNFFLQTCTGIILYLFSIEPETLLKRRNLILLSIIGLFSIYGFFVKFSTGIIQLFVYILVFILFLKDHPIKLKLIIVGSIIFGACLGFFSYFMFFQGYSEWILNFKQEYLILSDHSPVFIFERYFNNFQSFFIFNLRYFSWLLIFPIFIYYQRNIFSNLNSRGYQYLRFLILFISVIIFIYELYYFKFYRSTFASTGWKNAYIYIVIISLQLSILLAYKLKEKSISYRFFSENFNILLLLSLLFLTPFIGAFGTRNIIFLNALIHSAPWFVTILILLIYLAKKIKSQVIISLFIIIPSLVTTTQIIDGNTFIPYHALFFTKNKSNQFHQTEKVVEISRLSGIYVDKKTKTFLLELKQLLLDNNFKKGYPIFGFHMPGIVYLMEGISPGMPYYFNRKRDLKAFENFNLQNNPPIIMLTDENPIIDELLLTMNAKGVDFPDSYLMKGEVYFPNTKSMLKVYFPN